MNQKLLFGAIVVVLLGVLVGGFAVKSPALGGVNSADGYFSTTTRSTSASASAGWKACTGPCIFGSVVVDQLASAGFVRIYDATTTATSTYQGETSVGTYGREIAHIDSASDVAGTYVFDVVANKGIVVETSTGFNGHYIITYKR
jgi:hypothetical protein